MNPLVQACLALSAALATPLPTVAQESPAAPVAPEEDRDAAIETRLREIYRQVEELDGVEVEVEAGVVHLTGTAFDATSRQKAEDLAARMDGVVLVDNDTEEATDLDERLLPSVERLSAQVRRFVAALPLFGLALAVAALFWWLAARLARMRAPFARLSDNALIQNIARQLVRVLVTTLGIFIGLELIGATALVGAVLGSVGVVSLALGLAFRDIAENYLASIVLSIRRPFRTKDVVEIEGELGKVIRMTTRETELVSFDGNHVLLPNSVVFKSKIVNYTRARKRRIVVAVGLGTDVDLREATALGLEIMGQVPGIVGDPAPSAWIEALDDSSVAVKFAGWFDQGDSDFLKVQSAAIRSVKEAMEAAGYDMPEPTYRLLVSRPGSGEAEASTPVRRPQVRSAPDDTDVSVDSTLDEVVEEDRRVDRTVDLLSDD